MSIQAKNFNLLELGLLKGFDRNAIIYAEKARCPFYSFLTFATTKESEIEYVICQIYKLNAGSLESTLSPFPDTLIPCFILSAETINKFASKKFSSHPDSLNDSLEFDLIEALTFSGPYQYGFRDRIPDWQLHFHDNPDCLHGRCNVCNFQRHAITVLPDIFLELEPSMDSMHRDISALVAECLKK
jgi:hypothetical protein